MNAETFFTMWMAALSTAELSALYGAVLIALIACALAGYALGRRDEGGIVREADRREYGRLQTLLDDQKRRLHSIVNRAFGERGVTSFDALCLVLAGELDRLGAELERLRAELREEKGRCESTLLQVSEADKRRHRAEGRQGELLIDLESEQARRMGLEHRIACVRLAERKLRGHAGLGVAELLQLSAELALATSGPMVARIAYFQIGKDLKPIGKEEAPAEKFGPLGNDPIRNQCLLVPCPLCRAAVGELCSGSSGLWHYARYVASCEPLADIKPSPEMSGLPLAGIGAELAERGSLVGCTECQGGDACKYPKCGTEVARG